MGCAPSNFSEITSHNTDITGERHFVETNNHKEKTFQKGGGINH